MPTYGYECLACKNQTEVFQSIKDAPLTTCEVCGGSLRKRIYPVGIAFKGSGFYVNDYGAKQPQGESGSSASSDVTTETKSDSVKTEPAKTEAQPAKKSDVPAPAAA